MDAWCSKNNSKRPSTRGRAAGAAMTEGGGPARAEDGGPAGAEDGGPARAEDGGPARAEVCVVACAEAWRGDGAILASPMGLIPTLGAKLAQLTFTPGLLLTDGEATLLAPGDPDGVTEGWLPYRNVFTMLAAGLRQVMMGAAQLDRFGNQNISCIGD